MISRRVAKVLDMSYNGASRRNKRLSPRVLSACDGALIVNCLTKVLLLRSVGDSQRNLIIIQLEA